MSIPLDHRNTIRHSLLCLYILSYLLRACAQSYTTLDEKTLYYIPILARPQLFSLDLTRSWNAAQAPLELLPSPPLDQPYVYYGRNLYLSALAVNYDSLLYFNSHRAPSVYNVTTKTWRPGTRLTDANATLPLKAFYGNQVATDPSTGMAYIPSVGQLDNFPMYSYNTHQNHVTNATKTIVPGVAIPYSHYGAVWSTVRKSVLFYGGTINNTYTMGLMEYQPSNNQWTNVKTQGATTPGGVRSPCMASAYNGTKILMFGNSLPPYSVFILDVKTLEWTQGADPKVGEERISATCTVVGDYFIVAGGTPPPSGGILQQVLVYNIKLNQWTDSYEASKTPTTTTGVGDSSRTETASPGVSQEQPSGKGMPMGSKIGIVAGGSLILIILSTCGAFLIRRRKLRKSHQADQLGSDSSLYCSKSTLEPSDNQQQQPAIQNQTLRGGPSSSPDGLLRLQGARNPQTHSSKPSSSPSFEGLSKRHAARNPQHHSSSISIVAVQQWQCAQKVQDPQYIPSPPFAITTAAYVQHLRHGSQDDGSVYHDRLDRGVFCHAQHRHASQEDHDYDNHAMNDSAMHPDRHPNNPQISYGDPSDEVNVAMHQDPRMNAPQDYGHPSTGKGVSFSNFQRRPNPQDPTRRSTASQLEFSQVQFCNNPQDHGKQVDQDNDALYQEIERIRAQEEEYMRRRQSLERVCLEKEAKLLTFAGRANYTYGEDS